jgi:hypothetical protein
MGILFPSLGTHIWTLSSHQLPALQSASTSHPPGGSQTPLTLHAPCWHTTGPVATVQGPSPSA